jgi:hypothetical protein
LADQFQFRKPIEQRGANLRPLTNQHQRFGIPQPLGQHIQIVCVVVPDFNLMAFELLETDKPAQSVMIIVKYRNFHASILGPFDSDRYALNQQVGQALSPANSTPPSF